MLITGGRARGIPLRVPSRGSIRPATDQLRQAVFSSLGSMVEGSQVLDLFAGTGSWGLEAYSRGATSVVFVERDRGAIECLATNRTAVAKSLGRPAGETSVVRSDVMKWQPGGDRTFDLVFADPPFEMERIEELPELIFDRQLLKKEGWFILEHSDQKKFSRDSRIHDQRKYGGVNFSLFASQ